MHALAACKPHLLSGQNKLTSHRPIRLRTYNMQLLSISLLSNTVASIVLVCVEAGCAVADAVTHKFCRAKYCCAH